MVCARACGTKMLNLTLFVVVVVVVFFFLNSFVFSSIAASQYRDFLLFYGLHALEGVLPYIYHAHFALLVRGVYILSQSKITPEEMQIAAHLLDKFYEKMDVYYGEFNWKRVVN